MEVSVLWVETGNKIELWHVCISHEVTKCYSSRLSYFESKQIISANTTKYLFKDPTARPTSTIDRYDLFTHTKKK